MNPEALWQAFLTGTIEKNALVDLGKGLFFGRKLAKLPERARTVVAEVAARAKVSSETLYGAMNRVPLGGMSAARKLLGQFGKDILGKQSWEAIAPSTRKLVMATASALPGSQAARILDPRAPSRVPPQVPMTKPAPVPSTPGEPAPGPGRRLFTLYRRGLM